MPRHLDPLPHGAFLAGRYELGRELGRGGSSIVVEATDVESGRVVAVKVLAPEPEHRVTERLRLLREARLTASLRHPGIVRVLDHGTLDDGRAYLVMERLRGRTLKERLRDCFWIPLDEGEALAGTLLGALDEAHRSGVVHRDVTPANVFLRDGGAPTLIDFGIGRDLGDPSSRVTEPEVVVGTLGYMAPEQLFGDEPTARGDVYAIGATLYEAMVGRPPRGIVDGDIRSVFQALTTAPTPIEELRPAVRPALARGIERALEASPRARPATCAELAELCEIDLRRAA